MSQAVLSPYDQVKVLGKGYKNDDTLIVEMPGYVYDIYFRINENLSDEDTFIVASCKETRRNLGTNERERMHHRYKDLVTTYSQSWKTEQPRDIVNEVRNLQDHNAYREEFLDFDTTIQGAYTPYQPVGK